MSGPDDDHFDYRDSMRDFLLAYENLRRQRVKILSKKRASQAQCVSMIIGYIQLCFRAKAYTEIVNMIHHDATSHLNLLTKPTIFSIYIRAKFRSNRQRIFQEHQLFISPRLN